jgi:hypothetical protein
MIKEPFNSPRKKKMGNLLPDTPLKRVETMSSHSHKKFNSVASIDGSSIDGGNLKNLSKQKNYKYCFSYI